MLQGASNFFYHAMCLSSEGFNLSFFAVYLMETFLENFCAFWFICLSIFEQGDDAKVKTAFNTLLTYAKNVATKPDEEKFRKIRLSNAAFQVGCVARNLSVTLLLTHFFTCCLCFVFFSTGESWKTERRYSIS